MKAVKVSACQQCAQPRTISAEIAGSGDDSPVCSLTSQPLPEPWLFDSESLLRELARCRETALQVPITSPNATHFGLQLVISALWTLEQNLRFLLQLHREMQNSVRKQSEQSLKVTSGTEEQHQTIYGALSCLWITC
jgi:hypothetical protein